MPIPEHLIADIERLEPLPITTQRLLEVLGKEESSFDEIVRIVEHDQAVAANLLRVANSSMLGARIPIESLHNAIVRLGRGLLLEITLGQHVKTMIHDAPLYELTENELWWHGAVSAIAVREIARACPDAGIPPLASTAALVHDLGKLIMVRGCSTDVAQIRELCATDGLTFVEAEREVFGCDHSDVGGAMARAWGFPDDITDAIALHHQFPMESSTPARDAVAVANFVAKTVGAGLGAEGMNLKVDPECIRRLSLEAENLCRICVETLSRAEELRELLGGGPA